MITTARIMSVPPIGLSTNTLISPRCLLSMNLFPEVQNQSSKHGNNDYTLLGVQPHSQFDADLPAGMGMPNNGPKLMAV